jgi:hypothetical protein
MVSACKTAAGKVLIAEVTVEEMMISSYSMSTGDIGL